MTRPTGRREAPGPPPSDREARDARRRRARDEALDVRERSDRPFRSFEVRNPLHGTSYRVLAPGPSPVLLCPCPDFGHRGIGTCKHVEAVRPFLALASTSGRRTWAGISIAAFWDAVDRATAELPIGPWSDLRPAWSVGRPLIDPPRSRGRPEE